MGDNIGSLLQCLPCDNAAIGQNRRSVALTGIGAVKPLFKQFVEAQGGASDGFALFPDRQQRLFFGQQSRRHG